MRRARLRKGREHGRLSKGREQEWLRIGRKFANLN